MATLVGGFGAWGVYDGSLVVVSLACGPMSGATALAVSMIGPSWLADGASAMSLISLQLAVALVLVLGFTTRRQPIG